MMFYPSLWDGGTAKWDGSNRLLTTWLDQGGFQDQLDCDKGNALKLWTGREPRLAFCTRPYGKVRRGYPPR
jgi:hypothetical protein